MKRLSTALAATALLALAGCGSRTANNTAAIDTSNDVYNVSPDDLTANVSDLGNGSNASTGGNMASGGNGSSGSANMSSGNSHRSAGGNSASSGHSTASHAAGNSH